MASGRADEPFDRLLRTYFSLAVNDAVIARKLKKTVNAGVRSKLIAELQSLDRKRYDLLDRMGELTKSNQSQKSSK